MDALLLGTRSCSLLWYGFRWSVLLSLSSSAHAGVTGGVRGPNDIDPLRTPWVYYETNDPNIGCRESEQAIIDAYIAAKTGDPVCNVVYVGNDGWPTDPHAGSQWKVEHCLPSESNILEGYHLTPWAKKPVVKQSTRYYFTQTITHDHCPDNMFDIDVDQGFARVLYRYCPGGYDIRVLVVDGVADWSRYYCTRGVDTPERDQEGSCLAVGMINGGNPIYLGSGNKNQKETDFVDERDARFTLERHYNSMSSIYRGVPPATGIFGVNWSSTFERRVRYIAEPSSQTVLLYRADGQLYYFNNENGAWKSNSAIAEQLIQTASGWEYRTRDDIVEVYDSGGGLAELRYRNGVVHALSYDAAGRLSQVTTNTGESLTFAYVQDAPVALVESVMDHAGRVWRYAYDSNNNLVSVAGPDGTPGDDSDNPVRVYHYEDVNFPHALTGITDERGIRYATFSYDPNSHIKGRALTSYYGGAAEPVDRVDVNYNGHDTYSDGMTVRSVTNSEGGVTTYTTILQNGVALLQDVSGPGCGDCAGGQASFSYDPVTNDLLERTENGVTTEFGNYDANGNPGYMIEARGTGDERRTDYTYDPRYFDSIASLSEPSVYAGENRVTTYAYDDYGNRISESVAGFTPAGLPVTRTTRYQYNGPFHQLSRIDGPRNDVNDITTFRYYPDDPAESVNRARLAEIENANGDLVRSNIRYSMTGKLVSEERPGGVSLLYSYYPGNDRLEYLHESTASGSRSTRWTYLATGEVESITVAEGSPAATSLAFTYDAARRLVRITDGIGNYIHYTLDGNGNHLEEKIYDASGTLQDELDDVMSYALAQTFDAYNRLDMEAVGSGVTGPLELVDNDYLQNGTLDRVIDGNNIITDYSYNALQHLLTSTRDLGGINATTRYGYDPGGNLAAVTDPNNGTTAYSHDDLGNLLSTTSPDTGTTVYTYDEAGNMLSRKTASGTPEAVTLVYSYDALNRLTQVTTPESADDVIYNYDDCENGEGRVCGIYNGYANVFWQYDGFGNVSAHQGIRYTHDMARRLKALEYPSGIRVSYAYDASGKISRVDMTINGITAMLASNINYMPFGDVATLTYGNGHNLMQEYDTAYRLVSQMIPAVLQLNYVDYDANGNLRQRTDAGALPGVNYSYTYDSLDRLDTAAGGFGSGWDYVYDGNGNRILGNEGIPVSLVYEADSSRLDQVGGTDVILDVAGNTLAKGNWNYSYTTHQRLQTTSDTGGLVADYAYNGLGQRVVKNVATGDGRRFLYGPDGKLMAETDTGGTVLVEYIWLNGQVLAIYHPDSDQDGITNLQELEQGGSPGSADIDGDGLLNIDELLVHGTSPANVDFDGDGITDGDEVAQGTDPRDPGSVPFMATPGDINADGQVDLADYLLLTRFVLGYKLPSVAESQSADMNQDGMLNAGDLVLLSRAMLRISWHRLMEQFVGQKLANALGNFISSAEATVPNGKLFYVHNDHLGTPQVMTDENGNVVWRAVYAPFGEASIDAASTVEMNLRFPGQYYDHESGLHYNYYRYYDPDTGRYMRSDPVGVLLDFSEPQRQVAATVGVRIPVDKELGYINHGYNYVRNNPANRIDPTGEIDPLTAGFIIWGLLYSNNAGDAISDINGNVWGESQDQDEVCTLPFPMGSIANKCVLSRCQRHDSCYDKNQCTASSWVSSVLGGTKPCNQCNGGFFK